MLASSPSLDPSKARVGEWKYECGHLHLCRFYFSGHVM